MYELLKKVRLPFKKQNAAEKLFFIERNEIISDLNCAKAELDRAISNFSFATEPALIELYSYQIKAAQVKYNYHLTRAKRIAP